MKRIVIILGVMIVGVIALLETSGKEKRKRIFVPETDEEYDEGWWELK